MIFRFTFSQQQQLCSEPDQPVSKSNAYKYFIFHSAGRSTNHIGSCFLCHGVSANEISVC